MFPRKLFITASIFDFCGDQTPLDVQKTANGGKLEAIFFLLPTIRRLSFSAHLEVFDLKTFFHKR